MKKTAHQIASHVLTKVAAITDDEIASGLAGKSLRQIPGEEVEGLAQDYADRAHQKFKHSPLWMGGIGGALGGGFGASLGRGKGRLLGGLMGLGAGGGLGYGLGALQRSAATSNARNLGSTVGDIAQSGRIPYGFPGNINISDLVSYAKGVQGNPEPVNSQDEQAIRDRLANRLMLVRGTEGAITGGLASALSNRDREDSSGDTVLNAAIHGGVGTLRGRSEARELARQVLDLKSRGYGTLSDRYYNEAMNPDVATY
jgi:hypothetical protein